jgi:hypothetical protein
VRAQVKLGRVDYPTAPHILDQAQALIEQLPDASELRADLQSTVDDLRRQVQPGELGARSRKPLGDDGQRRSLRGGLPPPGLAVRGLRVRRSNLGAACVTRNDKEVSPKELIRMNLEESGQA